MCIFVGTLPFFKIAKQVAMEIVQFHINKRYIFVVKWPNRTILHQLEMLLVVQYRPDYPMGY